MKASLSNVLDTKAIYPIAFDPVSTTPWQTPGTGISSYLQLGLDLPAYVPHQQTGTKGWTDKVAFYDTEDEVSSFVPIPSVQEKGYYGARKVERRPSAPKVPSELSHSHKELTNDAVKHVITLISNLTVSTAVRKDKWEARLDELHTYERGWDSYDAESPSMQSISNARAFMAFLRTVAKKPAALNPSTVGGVGFTFRDGQRSVYIEFRNTGNAHVAYMGAGKPRVEKVTQSTDGFRALMHQVEKHLYEQDAAAA